MPIRETTPADLAQLVVLHNAAYPAVPRTTEAEFAELLERSDFALVAAGARDDASNDASNDASDDASDDVIVRGSILVMRCGTDYASENYRWFEARGTDFLYVDRIVVAPDARGNGIGRELYDRIFALARLEGRTEVTCEVNLLPPNPESLAFHARLGFERVGEQDTTGGTVRVALLAARI